MMRRDILNIAGLVAGVLVLAIGGPLLVRQLRSLPTGTLAARADQRIVTLEVSGMTCAGCAGTVQSRLAAVGGVSAAAVRYPQRRAYVVCDRAVADSSLIAAVRGAGPGFGAAVTVR
jgi:copper chaperone CopZ